MTHFDPRSELTLESARGAREPTAADRARNLAALDARLGLLQGSAAAPPAPVANGLRVGELGSAVRALKWKLTSLAVFTGMVGFLAGLSLGQRVSTAAQASPAPAAVVVALQPSEVAVSAAPLTAAVELTQPTVEISKMAAPQAPIPEAAIPVPAPKTAAKPRVPHLALNTSPPGAAATRGATQPGQRVAPGDGTFLAALRLLERARRALDGGDAGFAMSLLDDLDARFAASVLAEERQVTRVLGWCALGDSPRAQSAAASLLRNNPSSIYAGRLEHSCVR